MEMLPTSPAKHLAFFLKLKNPKIKMDKPMIMIGDLAGLMANIPSGAEIYIMSGTMNDNP